jgi:hypothetical protein
MSMPSADFLEREKDKLCRVYGEQKSSTIPHLWKSSGVR